MVTIGDKSPNLNEPPGCVIQPIYHRDSPVLQLQLSLRIAAGRFLTHAYCTRPVNAAAAFASLPEFFPPHTYHNLFLQRMLRLVCYLQADSPNP